MLEGDTFKPNSGELSKKFFFGLLIDLFLWRMGHVIVEHVVSLVLGHLILLHCRLLELNQLDASRRDPCYESM